jgi:hypothetical protein
MDSISVVTAEIEERFWIIPTTKKITFAILVLWKLL